MDAQNYVSGTNRGTFIVIVNGQQIGEFNNQSEAEQAFNAHRQSAAGAAPTVTVGGGEQGMPTANGMKTISQMRSELAAAGYNGGQSDGEIMAAYTRTSSGGGAGGGTGGAVGAGGAGGGNLAQLQAAESAMMDAIASGNREKYEQAKLQYREALAEQRRASGQGQRNDFSDRQGYDPGAGYGQYTPGKAATPGSAPGGSYSTVMGPRTLQQMASELKTAGWGGDPNNEAEVVAAYARTAVGPDGTKGPVTAGSGAGLAGTPATEGTYNDNAQLNAGWSKRLTDLYGIILANKQKTQPGLPALAPEDPEFVQAIVAEFGFTPEEAVAINRKGKEYFLATGQQIPEQVLQSVLNRAKPYGDAPTLDARKFVESQDQFDRNFGEDQRQFDQNEYSGMAKSILQAAANMRGPRDYAKYQEMLGGGRDVLSQLHGSTPQGAFGMTGTPERARVTDILSSMGLFSSPAAPRAVSGQAGGTGPGNVMLSETVDMTLPEMQRRKKVRV